MITATFFGEIAELGSRAVWYSDEEDDDSIEDGLELKTRASNPKSLEPTSHEAIRSNIHLNFNRISPNLKFTKCIISQLSQTQFKNHKISDPSTMQPLGFFDNIGKAFACKTETPDEFQLWLVFDSSAQYVSKFEVAYFVEALREALYSEHGLDPSGPIIIISQQYSSGEQLEYLSNYADPKLKLPFVGVPIAPPSLVRNPFESALFEQFTLSLKQAMIVCLPDPKNFWFDWTKNWPSVPNQIIEQKLSDDHLDKTLIFT